jgi:hypothetical protein
MSTLQIVHRHASYAAAAAAVLAVVSIGAVSVALEHQGPSVVPSGHQPVGHFHPTTSGGRTMLGE